MKHLWYMLDLCLFFVGMVACDDSEKLENQIDFTSPYIIQDDSEDPIQHQRYLIYEKYGIPVFFNDTVSKSQIDIDRDGKPIFRYETLDLNWSFSSHNKDNIKYHVKYITDAKQQLQALNFIDVFLAEASRPMRPFAIFLPSSFEIEDINKKEITRPEFWSGFRVLVIPEVQALEEGESVIRDFSKQILRGMVKQKVKKNDAVVEQFRADAEKNKWYNKPWVADGNNGGLGCVWGVEHKGTYWGPREIVQEYKETSFGTFSTVDYYIMYGYQTNISTPEEFEAERTIILSQIGNFGFICGGAKDGDRILDDSYSSPKDTETDLDYFLDQILLLGSERFLAFYGNSSLVLKKYNILTDYIENVLGVEL